MVLDQMATRTPALRELLPSAGIGPGTTVGLLLGTIARSMPQLGLLYLLVYLPLAMLSGSNTPLQSMPSWLATIMQASPTVHFVAFAQAILYRGAGFSVVWRQFLA